MQNFREKINSSSSEILCNIIIQTAKSSCTLTAFTGIWQSSPAISNPVLCRGAITTYTELAEWIVCGFFDSCNGQLWRIITAIALGCKLWLLLDYLTTHVSPKAWHIQAMLRYNYNTLLPKLITTAGCDLASLRYHLEITSHLHVAPSEPQIFSLLYTNWLEAPCRVNRQGGPLIHFSTLQHWLSHLSCVYPQCGSYAGKQGLWLTNKTSKYPAQEWYICHRQKQSWKENKKASQYGQKGNSSPWLLGV